MNLKPTPARWFELLVPRESLTTALTALSRTRAVQLQARSDAGTIEPPPALARALATFNGLRQRFGVWWPPAQLDEQATTLDPEARLERALNCIRDWIVRAEPRIATIESIHTERDQLTRLARFLELAGAAAPRPDLLAQAGPRLRARLFLVRGTDVTLVVPDGVLVQSVPDGAAATFVLAVGEARAVDAFGQALPAERTLETALPPWLPGGVDIARQAVQVRLDKLTEQLAPLRDELQALATSSALEHALADVAFVEWFATQVPRLELTGHFAWVTGWMRQDRAAAAAVALSNAHVPHLIRHPDPPAGLEPPVTLQNPRWAAPFELFVGMLGTPGREEADPSRVLAVIAPVIFGFMFGDVGQGAVLLALGLALRRRFSALALLVPGGLASVAFGLLFGSVFGREDLMDAWWLRPLESPLAVLTTSLWLGIGIIATGLAVDALAHAGSGLFGRWVRRRAGTVLTYAGGLLAALRPATGGALALLGVATCLAGGASDAKVGRRLAGAGQAAAELAETALQLAVNTVSFLRVGAFALAHAGLSVAIVGLAGAATSRPVAALILVLGNVFVLALEALLVGIQTTRLVLFEFFIRFLRGTGRVFRPLADAPLSPTLEHKGYV